MGLFLVYLILAIFGIKYSISITTTHHDKPDSVTISSIKSSTVAEFKITTPLLLNGVNITLSPSERIKRLLPYQNFYFDQPFNRPHQAGVSAQQYKDFEVVTSKKKQKPISFRPSDNLHESRPKFTPFLEANALPGPFLPILNPSQSNRQKYQYVIVDEDTSKDEIIKPESSPDLSSIYDKLSQLKLRQQAFQQNAPYGYRVNSQHHRHRERPQKLPEYRPTYVAPRYKIQPTKTTIETFTATNIDIPDQSQNENYEQPEPPRYHQIPTPTKDELHPPIRTNYYRDNTKPYIQHQIAIEVPQSSLPLTFKPTFVRKPPISPKNGPRTFLVIQQGKNGPKQPTYIIRKPKPSAVVEENYVAEKLVPVVYPKTHNYQSHKHVNVPLEPSAPVYENNYEEQYQVTPLPKKAYQHHQQKEYQSIDGPNNNAEAVQYNDNQDYYQYQPVTPGPTSSLPYTQLYHEDDYQVTSSTPRLEVVKDDSLRNILKQLQESNTLPETLTSDNIDNSIKTLVKILHALRDRQKQHKPIIVKQNDYDYDNEAGVDLGGDITDTPDGGTPGKPGVDYPALSTIPKTSFSCKTQRYKGFFGDPDTNCQVWHYCDLNGGQASFLCPNGTIFSQVALTCDWWFNVKCASTAQLYVLNERLYKYIIPLSPKFPEDYSGPLVDKYLAMKFQEMEEKLRKQKKGKGNHDSKESEDASDDDQDEKEENDEVNEEIDPTKEESRVRTETEESTTPLSENKETTIKI